jgi:hypothetical protein
MNLHGLTPSVLLGGCAFFSKTESYGNATLTYGDTPTGSYSGPTIHARGAGTPYDAVRQGHASALDSSPQAARPLLLCKGALFDSQSTPKVDPAMEPIGT